MEVSDLKDFSEPEVRSALVRALVSIEALEKDKAVLLASLRSASTVERVAAAENSTVRDEVTELLKRRHQSFMDLAVTGGRKLTYYVLGAELAIVAYLIVHGPELTRVVELSNVFGIGVAAIVAGVWSEFYSSMATAVLAGFIGKSEAARHHLIEIDPSAHRDQGRRIDSAVKFGLVFATIAVLLTLTFWGLAAVEGYGYLEQLERSSSNGA